jgi:hypothetical protein
MRCLVCCTLVIIGLWCRICNRVYAIVVVIVEIDLRIGCHNRVGAPGELPR